MLGSLRARICARTHTRKLKKGSPRRPRVCNDTVVYCRREGMRVPCRHATLRFVPSSVSRGNAGAPHPPSTSPAAAPTALLPPHALRELLGPGFGHLSDQQVQELAGAAAAGPAAPPGSSILAQLKVGHMQHQSSGHTCNIIGAHVCNIIGAHMQHHRGTHASSAEAGVRQQGRRVNGSKGARAPPAGWVWQALCRSPACALILADKQTGQYQPRKPCGPQHCARGAQKCGSGARQLPPVAKHPYAQ